MEFLYEFLRSRSCKPAEYPCTLQAASTEDDYIIFKFKEVAFIYNDMDPSSDNYDATDNPEGSENNGVWDSLDSNTFEIFDDFWIHSTESFKVFSNNF